MKKTLRRTVPKRRSQDRARVPRRAITRREYAEIVLRLGSVELQMQRNRAAIDVQTQRIDQLQEHLRKLVTAPPAQPAANEIPALPIPITIPTVES